MSMLDDYGKKMRREAEDRERMSRQIGEENNLRKEHLWEDQFIRQRRMEEDGKRVAFPFRQDANADPLELMRQRENRQLRQMEDMTRFSQQQDEFREMLNRHLHENDSVWERRRKEDELSILSSEKPW